MHMARFLFLLPVVSLAVAAHAQGDGLTTLTGANGQRWAIIGSSAPADNSCKDGDGTYDFQAKQVVIRQCAGGTWKSSTEALTVWSAGGKSGVAFGGTKYEVKSLPANAPACKGNANCVRLATVPDGKTDATRTLYLAH